VAADEVADEVKGVVEDSMTMMTDVIMDVQKENIEVVEDAMMTLVDAEGDRADTATDTMMTEATATVIVQAHQVITRHRLRLHHDNLLA
jgi:putative heme iron utilization protein